MFSLWPTEGVDLLGRACPQRRHAHAKIALMSTSIHSRARSPERMHHGFSKASPVLASCSLHLLGCFCLRLLIRRQSGGVDIVVFLVVEAILLIVKVTVVLVPEKAAI